MLLIDGSTGGGQLLRSSLSLSSLTKKPFRMISIRGKREKSGLQHQHLTAVNAIAKICNAKVKGNELHSHELEFLPSEIVPGNYKFDIGTAGSTTLILQTILPALIFSDQKSILEIIGGTANPMAPPALDIKEVFLWYLKNLGINVNLDINKEGFYPKGGGNIKVIINPCKKLKEINLAEPKHGHYESTKIFGVCSKNLKDKDVTNRMIKGFKSNFPVEQNIQTKEIYVDALSPGCFIHANYGYGNCKLGMSILGSIGRKSEDIGKECALKLLEEMKSGANTDHFTADQLLLYMALNGSGEIKISKLTDHMQTNIETIKKFLNVNFVIDKNIITCIKND